MITVTIAGHLGDKPEQRTTPSGTKVWSMRLAAKVFKNGEDKTVWWKITVWGDRWDKLISFLKKGSPLIVSGRMNPPDMYTDKNGNKQVGLEVVAEMLFLSPFGRSGQDEAQRDESTNFQQHESFQGITAGAGQANFAADDIPF